MDVEIKVTQTAQQIFNEATDPYIRVGANPGGCSGWKYELASTNDKFDDDAQFGSIVVNRDVLTNVIGSVTIDYQESENMLDQGFIFISNTGKCGCGQSFQPVNPSYARH